MIKDKILTNLVTLPLVQCYIYDCIQILCGVVENNFQNHPMTNEKTTEFLFNWLKLFDNENENTIFKQSPNRDIWILAHTCTLIEYEQFDLLSFYSACRITENLVGDQLFYKTLLANNTTIRSGVQEQLYKLMFRRLWDNVYRLHEKDENIKEWIYYYTLISKYHPSTRVLQEMESGRMNVKIELMNLIHLILLNNETPKPLVIIEKLFRNESILSDHFVTSTCLTALPIIIETVSQHFMEHNAKSSTLMMDIQHWIIATLKNSRESSIDDEVIQLLKFLNQPTCQLTLPMKQFLFDKLAEILMNDYQQPSDFWDRLCYLLPKIMKSIPDKNLNKYILPYHPNLVPDNNQNYIVIDLLFFHLQGLANKSYETVQPIFLNTVLTSSVPSIPNREQFSFASDLFEQLRTYFTIETAAILLCQKNASDQNQETVDDPIKFVINEHLGLTKPVVEFSESVKHFCATIIKKHSLEFLLNLLKSDRFQNINCDLANTLHDLLKLKRDSQRSRHLHYSHHIQFTISTEEMFSIFPTLHKPYDELKQTISECVLIDNVGQRWTPFNDWIQSKLNMNPPVVNLVEIKVLLLLNIYYDYYCNAQLNKLNNLLGIIENKLEPSNEERQVFRVMLDPEQYMEGYPRAQNAADKNVLNDLFKIDFAVEEQLPIRHTLVNLLAMILLGGNQSFLWTFAFEPQRLQGTYGFGSTRSSVISNIHYDCGCVILDDGKLDPSRGSNNLSDPEVYVVYFATFGALAWHLLLFRGAEKNLNGPIFNRDKVNESARDVGLNNSSERAKTSHFVCTRLIMTNIFLTMQLTQDDACLLFNRCFEVFAHLSRQHAQNLWIQPLYNSLDIERQAETEFKQKVFHPVSSRLDHHKRVINTVQSQSQLQNELQNYVSEMPITVNMHHFKMQLSNQKSIQLPLNILERFLNSFGILKMTKYIFHLSQFYVLLNRTFGQLIEKKDLDSITLQQLFELAKKSFTNVQQQITFKKIIANGIAAVEAYHKFTNGQIQPGACDDSKTFQPIEWGAPISYLVETDRSDEGNIVMRILSILVKYHNDFVQLLEKEITDHADALQLGLLKDIVAEFTQRKISIGQITEENMGVITLSEMDCSWIEEILRATLQNESNYFLKRDSLEFDFLYAQAYLVRNYLLFCRIDYEHIKEKYPCWASVEDSSDGDIEDDMDISFTEKWRYLEQKNLAQLQNEYNFLQQVISILKCSNENDMSMNLSDFIRKNCNAPQFIDEFKQYDIKNFPVSDIERVCKQYERLIHRFQHNFKNVPKFLRVPIEGQLNDELDHFLESFNTHTNSETKKEIQSKIETITELLKDFEGIESHFAYCYSQPLVEICKNMAIENPILMLIHPAIKCENYVSLGLKLIDTRLQLQNSMINLIEQTNAIWKGSFQVSENDQSHTSISHASGYSQADNEFNKESFNHENREQVTDSNLLLLLDLPEPSSYTETNPSILCQTNVIDLLSDMILPVEQADIQSLFERKNQHAPLFQLNITSVLLSPSAVFVESQKQAERSSLKKSNPRLNIRLTDGSVDKHICRPEKLYEKMKSIVHQKKLEHNTIAIIDPSELFVDFTAKNENNTIPIIESEYRIIEKALLIDVILEYENGQQTYIATAKAVLTVILARFIVDRKLKFSAPDSYLSVFDSLGRYIDKDCEVGQIYRSNEQAPIQIKVMQTHENMHSCYELKFTTHLSTIQSQYFHNATTWKNIGLWLKEIDVDRKPKVDNYYFLDEDSQNILDEDQSIHGGTEPFEVNVLSEKFVSSISLSCGQSPIMIQVLKTCPIRNILDNSKHLEKIQLKALPEDYTLLIIKNENDQRILSKTEIENEIGEYDDITGEPIQIRICTPIQIVQYDNKRNITASLTHAKMTVKNLLEQIKVAKDYKYLASHDTKVIFDDDRRLLDMNASQFFLVKENQTHLISMRQLDTSLMISQRFIESAKIGDVYEANKAFVQNKCITYEQDITPSNETPISVLFPDQLSLVQFILVDRKFQINVTVVDDQQKKSIQFQCDKSLLISRVQKIICKLWKLNPQKCCLAKTDEPSFDENDSIGDVADSSDSVILELKYNAETKCEIKYQNESIELTISGETLVSTILAQALEKLSISLDDKDMFELKILDDPENPTSVDNDYSIDDIRTGLSDEIEIIVFRLGKIENEDGSQRNNMDRDSIQCTFNFENKPLTIFTKKGAILSDVLEEVLQKFSLSFDDKDMFELKILDDPENPTSVELDYSMEDICAGFSDEIRTIPFLLKRVE